MITSSQNPKVKLARALGGRPKERRNAGAFLAEGVRLVETALEAGWPFRYALYSGNLSERARALVDSLQAVGLATDEIPPQLMDSLSETEASQGILAVLECVKLPLPETLDFLLIPDQVRDPGNLGALLRTAAAAGVQAVLLPPETTDAFAPKVVRAGMGAHFRLPILTLSWREIERLCQAAGLQMYLADMAGGSCWQTDLRSPLVLIVGGEAQGASAPARKLAHATLSLPMPGGSESLNAGVAGSLLLYEVVRQRA